MKAKHKLWLWMVLLAATCGGCIVHDQVMTLTINPDGSGDVVVFRSNIRSTAKGEKAEAELAKYRASFDAGTQDDLKRMAEAGARIETATWVREQAPLANIVRASIPEAPVLEKLLTERDDDGTLLIDAAFSISNTCRRLSLQATLKPDQIPSAPTGGDDAKQIQDARAAGFSELRIALSAGTITEARGFTIANDLQSALLDEAEANALLRSGQGNVLFFLEWDVPD